MGADQLGHAKVSTTENKYTILVPAGAASRSTHCDSTTLVSTVIQYIGLIAT